jgi:hypothetical protein
MQRFGAGASGSILVTAASGGGTLTGFVYLPSPTIISFSPTSAGTGQAVTIKGTNFTGATMVSFGGTSANIFTVVTDTIISALVGIGSSGNVSVSTSNGNAKRSGFTYITPPTTVFMPTLEKTGQINNITEKIFTEAEAVSLGDIATLTFNVFKPLTISNAQKVDASDYIFGTKVDGYHETKEFNYSTVNAQMIVSPTSTTLPATGGSLTASISSNLFWKVNSNANWLIPIGASGRNSGSLRVTFLANNGIARRGTITFTADGITRTMEIVQAAKTGVMNPSNELNGEFSEKPEVNAKEFTHIDWELFPNPSDGIINLTVKFSNLVETGSLNIRDIHGRVVKSVTNVRTGSYQFDLSSEPKGTYLFSLQDEYGEGLIIKQIILN